MGVIIADNLWVFKSFFAIFLFSYRITMFYVDMKFIFGNLSGYKYWRDFIYLLLYYNTDYAQDQQMRRIKDIEKPLGKLRCFFGFFAIIEAQDDDS